MRFGQHASARSNLFLSGWKKQCDAQKKDIRLRSTAVEIQSDVKTKKCTAQEVCKEWIQRLHASEDKINSFLYISEESAIAQAENVDLSLTNDKTEPGLLSGVPIAIKDNICTQGLQTTAGSRILENYKPTYDATVVKKLKSAGAVILGKTNMDEFGMGSSTENSAFKVTCNPWDTNRVPGGSSGGSAAAIAANQCVASLGSDTGGSIRQPAHFCGCVGIKPTYGRVSRYGLISYGSSLDAIGPMAKTVKDAALILQVIAGVDVKDSTSADVEVPDFVSHLLPVESFPSTPLHGKRIGLVQETKGEGVGPVILNLLDNTAYHLQQLGAEIEEVSVEAFEIGLPSYYIIALSEASSNLSRYDGVRYGLRNQAEDLQKLYASTRMNYLGSEVKRRILMGTYALSAGYYDAYYKRAQQVRTLLTRQLNEALGSFDALLTPAAPTLPWKIGELISDPLSMYKADLMSVGCNLAGLPGVVIPVGQTTDSKPLPVGLQLLGRSFGEKELIEIAHILELTLNRTTS